VTLDEEIEALKARMADEHAIAQHVRPEDIRVLIRWLDHIDRLCRQFDLVAR
jgi:hypothetical protein